MNMLLHPAHVLLIASVINLDVVHDRFMSHDLIKPLRMTVCPKKQCNVAVVFDSPEKEKRH